MLKAIVMDLDGTLMDGNDSIQPKTKEALISLEQQGVKCILASGRQYRRLISVAKELEMDRYGGYFIEINGLGYYDMETDSRYILHQMNVEEIREVFTYLMKNDCEVMACLESELYDFIPSSFYSAKEKLRKEMQVEDDFPWTSGPWSLIFDMRKAYPTIHYIQTVDEIKGKIYKLQFMDQPEKIESMFITLNEMFGERFEIFRTSYRQIELLPKGYDKGCTLKRIMKMNHWREDEVIAFGDGENDVSLFKQVKNSFAMGQAEGYVKELATYSTTSNNEEGIYNALVQYNYYKEK